MVNNANPDMPTFPLTEGRYGARTAFYAQTDQKADTAENLEAETEN